MDSGRGFTLIELMVTLAILALLATAATPMLQMTAKRQREEQLRRALWEIRDAIDAYKQAGDDGIIARPADKTGYPSSLKTLVDGAENVADPKKGKVYFLRNIPRDPFAADPELPAEATWDKRSYRSSFDAPKEGEDVYDVHSTSGEVGLNGRLYREW